MYIQSSWPFVIAGVVPALDTNIFLFLFLVQAILAILTSYDIYV